MWFAAFVPSRQPETLSGPASRGFAFHKFVRPVAVAFVRVVETTAIGTHKRRAPCLRCWCLEHGALDHVVQRVDLAECKFRPTGAHLGHTEAARTLSGPAPRSLGRCCCLPNPRALLSSQTQSAASAIDVAATGQVPRLCPAVSVGRAIRYTVRSAVCRRSP